MQKNKKTKKENQIVEIHIYIHKDSTTTYPPIYIPTPTPNQPTFYIGDLPPNIT